MSELLPTVQARDVQRGLLDYLTTTFALADADAQRALGEFLQDTTEGMFKGPYLRTRLPFRPAEPGWESLLGWGLPYTPYGHQAAAFSRLSSAGPGGGFRRPDPTLVTTGTGSGKTEAFLYPILDHVARARRAGITGMKALILYPMNALANDQAARLAGLLTSREELAGITAALYTGQQGPTRTTVTPDGLITDRAVIRDTAPDILLTNYKMLDQLLLRHEDQALWAQSAHSLQYLVLDEFHTYDGAQGTDVSMLLRRLGLALKSHWDPNKFTAAEWGRPLGQITPVATSATLGDKGDPAAMVAFATTVFGEPFAPDSVVTESRLTLAEWVSDTPERVHEWGLEPATLVRADLPTITAALPADGDAHTSAVGVLAALYGTTPDAVARFLVGDDPTRLLDLVKAHPLIHRVVEATGDAIALADLADVLFPDPVPAGPGAVDGEDDREVFLVHLAACLSHVRATAGRAAATVDLHLWVRELSRIDRVAASEAKFLWSDNGGTVLEDSHDPFGWAGRPAYPAVYCRHCGRSGWGVGLGPVGQDLTADDTSIRRNKVTGEGRFRAMLTAPAEADHALYGRAEVEGLRWFSVRQRTILAAPPQDDDPDFRDGWVLPVLALTGPGADDDSRKDTCPSCQQADGIRFLGSSIATLLSVSLSTLFGAPQLDAAEKKALVFTDSVQDAAHRAGFVESRSHVLTLRAVLREALGDSPQPLDAVVDRALQLAGDDKGRRYRLIPPELAERDAFAPYWQQDRASGVPARVRTRVRRRLLFDAVMEVGLQGRFGRTLEVTGSVGVEVDAGHPAKLAAIARAVLATTDVQDTLDETVGTVDDARLVAWVRGVLVHMRLRGAVEHEWFRSYLQEDGARWWIWGGRPKGQGMPAFPKGRSAPAFPRVGGAKLTGDPLLDPVTSPQSWYARWAARVLGVGPGYGAKLARVLLERLVRDGVLTSTQTKSGATVFAIPASALVLSPTTDDGLEKGDHLLVCRVCANRSYGTKTVVEQLHGAPCLLARCPGVMERRPRGANYYRTLYASTDMRRIVAREHSSILDDETRLSYENGFKRSQGDPSAPNVLVATPTLELGIDIGDLSTVLLASLPRTVASYLQRVGRAGRLTGNALELAFVTGRGEQLPLLESPLTVINGAVRPPATYLSAEEILERQYVAHLVDTFARDANRKHPRRATGAIGAAGPGTFLGDLIEYAESDPAGHLDRFLGTFEGLAEAAMAAVRVWATPDGPGTSALAAHLYRASQRWAHTVEELSHRRTAIELALPELEQRANVTAASEEDKRAYRSARAARKLLGAQLKDLRGRYWIQVLEEFGILPNYTLLDDSVTLDVALTWIDPDTQEFRSEPTSISRGAASALREFAPGATFYAKGLEIQVDSIDLGRDGDAIRTRAFCPDCGFVADVTEGTPPVAVCPRCGGPGIADTKQRLDVVELTRVSAEMRRDEAMIADSREDRKRESFTVFTAADINPANVARQWFVKDYDFGVRYLRHLDITWVNAGRTAGHGPAREIAGQGRPAPLFRVCRGCGRLDSNHTTNKPEEHRAWCRYRRTSEEHAVTVALTRSLHTQGVVLRLPASVTLGDTFAIPSLSAAILLGLREQMGGNPDHIQVTEIKDPILTPGGGDTADALLLHDTVPGGTGYLAELADPDRVWDLLHRAWTVIHNCACRDEGRLACHRCLLPFASPWQTDTVSREAAERHLRALLTGGNPGSDPGAVRDWELTEEPPGVDTMESHLELHFRKVFVERAAALGATVKEIPGPTGNIVRLTFPGGRREWKLEPQVNLGSSRPDFVLSCNDPGIPRIAIFTDGWLYHASTIHNRIGDDSAKRQDLRDDGILVLGITAADVQAAQTGTPTPPPWLHSHVVEELLATGAFGFNAATVEALQQGPFQFLTAWLQKPAIPETRALAGALPYLFAPGAEHGALDAAADLAREAVRRLSGEPAQPAGDTAGWWWQSGAVGVLARVVPGKGVTAIEVALVLDDDTAALEKAGHREAWAEWLRISNALNLREQPTTITTVTEVAEGPVTAGPAPTPTPVPSEGLTPAWQTVVDFAWGPEKDLARSLALTGLDELPQVGYEVDGIPLDFAWAHQRVAVARDLTTEERTALEAQGWTFLAPDPATIASALATRERGEA